MYPKINFKKRWNRRKSASNTERSNKHCIETNFEQEILKEHGFQNKVKLIEYINTEGKHIGIDTFSLIIEKYNICVYIWNDNEINGKKWIIIYKKQNESQENLFLNYKDYKDKYPEDPEIAERYAHYVALILEKYPNDKINNIL